MTEDVLDVTLRERLSREVDAAPPAGDDPVVAVRRLVHRRRRRRRRGAMAGLAVAAATAAGVLVQPGPAATEKVTAEAPRAAGVAAGEGVTTAPPPPLGVRGDAAVVWTGTEVVVWGGDLEAANMGGRQAADAVYADGAAYDPVTRRWRTMAPSPVPASRHVPLAAMTDAGVVVVRGVVTALWDPGTDTWRSLDDAPAGVGDLVSTGPLAVSASANAALDPATGTWRELPEPPVRLDRVATAWTGDDVVVVGGHETWPSGPAVAVAWDPGTGRWRQLADPPAAVEPTALDAAWDGRRLVVVTYGMAAAAWDPRTATWRELPPVPARDAEFVPTVVAAGGLTVARMAAATVVLDDDDSWVPLPGDVVEVGWGTAVAGPPGTVVAWGVHGDANRLTVVDVRRAVEAPARVQAGPASVVVPAGHVVAGASLEGGAVLVLLDEPGGGCSVEASRSSAPGPGATVATTTTGGRVLRWAVEAGGTVWRTSLTGTDHLGIVCDDPATAELLARSVEV